LSQIPKSLRAPALPDDLNLFWNAGD